MVTPATNNVASESGEGEKRARDVKENDVTSFKPHPFSSDESND